MTKTIIITCDLCEEHIDKAYGPITISAFICEIFMEVHFCSDKCMRAYLMRKWNESG